MEELQKHDTKQKKADAKDHTCHMIPFAGNMQEGRSIGTESKGREVRQVEFHCLVGTVSLWADDTVLELDGGRSCVML